MGHADAGTTARYLHYKPRKDEARRLAAAFKIETPPLDEPARDEEGAGRTT